MKYYCKIQGRVSGPHRTREIKHLVADGSLGLNDHIRPENSQRWTRTSNVVGLAESLPCTDIPTAEAVDPLCEPTVAEPVEAPGDNSLKAKNQALAEEFSGVVRESVGQTSRILTFLSEARRVKDQRAKVQLLEQRFATSLVAAGLADPELNSELENVRRRIDEPQTSERTRIGLQKERMQLLKKIAREHDVKHESPDPDIAKLGKELTSARDLLNDLQGGLAERKTALKPNDTRAWRRVAIGLGSVTAMACCLGLAIVALAMVYSLSGDQPATVASDDSLAALKKSQLERDKQRSETQAELAQLISRGDEFSRDGQWKQAISMYQQAAVLDPESALPHSRRGRAHMAMDQHKTAIDKFDDAISRGSEDAATLANRGLCYLKLSNYAPAVRDFSSAIKLEPSTSRFYRVRGDAHRLSNNLDAAIRDYDSAIRLDKTAPSTYALRGRLRYSHRKDLDGAIKDFSQSLKLAPQVPQTYLWRAEALLDQQHYARAASDLKRCIELNPNLSHAYFLLAGAQMKNEAYPAAHEALRKYRKLKPDDLFSIAMRADIYQHQQDYGRAVKDLQTLVKHQPNNADLYELMASWKQKLGDSSYKEDLLTARRLRKPAQKQSSFNSGNLFAQPGYQSGYGSGIIDYEAEAIRRAKEEAEYEMRKYRQQMSYRGFNF